MNPLPDESRQDHGEPSDGGSERPGNRANAKKPWHKPTVTAIWDELAGVGSAPNPSGPGAESPTYQQIS